MGLIDQNAAIRALEIEKELCEERSREKGIDDAIEVIRIMCPAQAILIDDLCELFDETEITLPCSLCKKIIPEWCDKHNVEPMTWDKRFICPTWKQVLTKWKEEKWDIQDTNGL